MKASKLKVGDLCYVYFTDSVCECVKKDYDYGRTQIYLKHFENGIYEITIISPDTEVELVKL